MKIKSIIAMVILGTSGLRANAHKVHIPSAEASQKADLHWNYSPSDQNLNQHPDPDVARYSAVPEASTVLAGAVLLIPLGVSLVRNFRRNKKTSVNI